MSHRSINSKHSSKQLNHQNQTKAFRFLIKDRTNHQLVPSNGNFTSNNPNNRMVTQTQEKNRLEENQFKGIDKIAKERHSSHSNRNQSYKIKLKDKSFNGLYSNEPRCYHQSHHNKNIQIPKTNQKNISKASNNNNNQLKEYVKNMKKPSNENCNNNSQFGKNQFQEIQQNNNENYGYECDFEDNDDKMSVKSKASVYSKCSQISKCSNYSKNSKYSQTRSQFNSFHQKNKSGVKKYSNSNKNKKIMNIYEIEQKLEQIIKLKLNKMSKINPFPQSKRIVSEFDEELAFLTKTVKQLKFFSENQDSTQTDTRKSISLIEDLKNLSSKIIMLQKIIAQSATQSQLMKRFYHVRRIHRKSSLVNKHNFTLYKSANILQQLTNSCNESGIGNFQEGNKTASGFYQTSDIKLSQKNHIGYQTTNNFSFKKPNRKDYQINPKHKISTFRINRQPLPRSTYSCQYLTYGTLPRYNYHDNSNTYFGKHEAFPKNINSQTRKNNPLHESTYKNDFKNHQNQNGFKYDYKELDCYRDKFKNVQISFMDNCNKNDHQNIRNSSSSHNGNHAFLLKKHRKNEKKQYEGLSKTKNAKRNSQNHNQINSINPKKTSNTNGGFGINSFETEAMKNLMKTTLISQTQKQFITKEGRANPNKDKNLNFLKNSYKSMLRA